jgi:hypothetical protein
MIESIDQLIDILPVLRPSIFSASRSDVIRVALMIGLESLTKEHKKLEKAANS